MIRLNFSIALFSVLTSLCASSAAYADDHGAITLQCEGDTQQNDDPLGRNSNIRYAHQQGNAIIDFDRRQFHFLDWGEVPLTTIDRDHISAKLGTFETDTNLANIELNRLTGEAYFQYWVHDHNQKVFWYRHIFVGKCGKKGQKF